MKFGLIDIYQYIDIIISMVIIMVEDKNDKCNTPELIPIEHLREGAERLKCVAHPHRLRIIEILLNGECTVGEIAKMCKLSQSITSVHLRLMHGKKLLTSERRDRYVYYTLADTQLEVLLDFVESLYPKRCSPNCVNAERAI